MSTTIVIPGPAKVTLSVKDHTRVIETLMRQPEAVAALFPPNSAPFQLSRFDRRGLELVTRLASLDDDLRQKLVAIVPTFDEIGIAYQKLSPRTLAIVSDVRAAVRVAKGVEAKLATLRRLAADPALKQVLGLAEGVNVAIAIAEDGRQSIYAASHPFYLDMHRRRSEWTVMNHSEDKKEDLQDQVLDEDIDGAIKGGVGGAAGGALAGGPAGAAAGGLAGGLIVGVASSGIKMINDIKEGLDGLFGDLLNSL